MPPPIGFWPPDYLQVNRVRFQSRYPIVRFVHNEPKVVYLARNVASNSQADSYWARLESYGERFNLRVFKGESTKSSVIRDFDVLFQVHRVEQAAWLVRLLDKLRKAQRDENDTYDVPASLKLLKQADVRRFLKETIRLVLEECVGNEPRYVFHFIGDSDRVITRYYMPHGKVSVQLFSRPKPVRNLTRSDAIDDVDLHELDSAVIIDDLAEWVSKTPGVRTRPGKERAYAIILDKIETWHRARLGEHHLIRAIYHHKEDFTVDDNFKRQLRYAKSAYDG
ncbi:hypothetical protein EDD37DRAFT_636764 [Exophiala viscosa]|uniref:uncharacterized protein n=1 Tax=Exophiala viscosa TaxID=2486360 RepID=UPI002194165A|nr:hypothetical protein EDD37DRAFT_636764 [Exophiala viscosa]